jgi:hypothetical protein
MPELQLNLSRIGLGILLCFVPLLLSCDDLQKESIVCPDMAVLNSCVITSASADEVFRQWGSLKHPANSQFSTLVDSSRIKYCFDQTTQKQRFLQVRDGQVIDSTDWVQAKPKDECFAEAVEVEL